MGTQRELEDGTEIDRDDRALDTEEVPYDKLMEILTASDDAPGDDVAFGTGTEAEDKPSDVVSVDDGLDLIDKADAKTRASAKVEAPKADGEDSQPAAQGEDTAPADQGQDSQPAAAPDDLDALLDGLADDRKQALRDRVKGADAVLDIFKGREAELKMHGVDAPTAMRRLVEINAYASKNPSDYLAWAATQFGSDPAEVLGKAAERLGFKLTAAVEKDDPFEDEEVKSMRRELAALKAKDAAPALGPDAPQNRAQSELEAFAKASPHWGAVGPQVAALATAHVQSTQKPATLADIERFYKAAVFANGLEQPAPVAANPAPAVTSAAQPAPAVQQKPQTTAAAPSASVERAKAASRSLDGSGQGAGRRPAVDADAPIKDVLAAIWDQQSKGG